MHLPSVLFGIALAYAPGILVIVMCAVGYRRVKEKARDKRVDQLLADVAIQCIERPVDVRMN